MAMDGKAIMQPKPHFEWFCRSLLMLNRALLRQLPAEYAVEMDAQKFLRSITMELDGLRHRPEPWHLAPDGPVHPPKAPGTSSVPPTSHRVSPLYLLNANINSY